MYRVLVKRGGEHVERDELEQRRCPGARCVGVTAGDLWRRAFELAVLTF